MPLRYSDFEVAIGGSDHPHIDFHFLIAADRANFFFLQHAQQFGLHLQRQLSDLIEKNRSPAGRLEQSRLGTQRAGKSPFFIAKELAFNQGRNQRAAIHGDKRTVSE